MKECCKNCEQFIDAEDALQAQKELAELGLAEDFEASECCWLDLNPNLLNPEEYCCEQYIRKMI